MDIYKHPTVNAFTQKPHIAQIGSYIIMIVQIALFYVCIYPIFNQENKFLTFGVVYPVTFGILAILALVCSVIDPSDPTVK